MDPIVVVGQVARDRLIFSDQVREARRSVARRRELGMESAIDAVGVAELDAMVPLPGADAARLGAAG